MSQISEIEEMKFQKSEVIHPRCGCWDEEWRQATLASRKPGSPILKYGDRGSSDERTIGSIEPGQRPTSTDENLSVLQGEFVATVCTLVAGIITSVATVTVGRLTRYGFRSLMREGKSGAGFVRITSRNGSRVVTTPSATVTGRTTPPRREVWELGVMSTRSKTTVGNSSTSMLKQEFSDDTMGRT
uniref:Uncharacterized protein n=1 Tax=Timema poppense TaxID=170557 RepID=A0A7R9DLT1_TIMPO|nr:unnamed protein product [Timema poppensis]